jgi:hypothetical protein
MSIPSAPSFRIASFRLTSLWVIGAFFASCTFLDSDRAPADLLVSEGESFRLLEGQAARLRGSAFRVAFIARTGESRCPLGVQCIWEGEAEVEMALSISGPETDTLRVRGYLVGSAGRTTAVSRFGYRVSLDDLAPYPAHEQPLSTPASLALRIDRER